MNRVILIRQCSLLLRNSMILVLFIAANNFILTITAPLDEKQLMEIEMGKKILEYNHEINEDSSKWEREKVKTRRQVAELDYNDLNSIEKNPYPSVYPKKSLKNLNEENDYIIPIPDPSHHNIHLQKRGNLSLCYFKICNMGSHLRTN